MIKPALLVEYIRNGLSEQTHYGYVLRINKSSVIETIGDSFRNCFYLRSCMKPLQASVIIDFELDNEFGFSDEEIAVAMASHVGEFVHTNLVTGILNKIGLNENDLLCPPEPPLSQPVKEELLFKQKPFRKIHSNCSGKHAMMLAACVKNRWNIRNYNNSEHKLQKYILKNISKIAGMAQEKIPLSKDGCGLPVCALPLDILGYTFLNFFFDPKYEKLKNIFKSNPYIIGGHNRIDSEIIKTTKGNLIAKVGAGGLIVVVNTSKEEAVVVKISDSSTTARALVLLSYLLKIGWLSDNDINNTNLKQFYDTKIRINSGEQTGQILCYV